MPGRRKRSLIPFCPKGQSVIEYSIILGLVVLALSMMQVYLRRGIQAGIKIAADEIGHQADSAGREEYEPGEGEQLLFSNVRRASFHREQLQHGPEGSRTVNKTERSEVVDWAEGVPSGSRSIIGWEEE